MSVEDFRARYPQFIYNEYSVSHDGEDLEVTVDFEVPGDIRFRPKVVFKGVSGDAFSKLDQDVVNQFAFHIGLAEIPSYWKATCSPNIVVRAGRLDDYQKDWWNKLILNGMGQFFFENKIDFTASNFVSIESSGDTHDAKATVPDRRILIPVGGGKDSAVTLELLGRSEFYTGAFMLNPIPSSHRITEIAQVPESINVQRTIDQRLLDLNAKGYLNGHTPFSSYLAFLTNFSAYLYGFSSVAFSNERSSDESNAQYLGMNINHQYSKTTQFESDFRDYCARYLSNIEYFSFLRPLHEIQIAKLFSSMPQYFEAFRSCNVGQKSDSWCEKCPKCLSTYILLFPFIDTGKLGKIFSKNLYEDDSLYPLLEELIRDEKVKPFECVGTREELKAALWLASQRFDGEDLPHILKQAKSDNLINSSLAQKANSLLSDWNGDHFVPENLEKILRKTLNG